MLKSLTVNSVCKMFTVKFLFIYFIGTVFIIETQQHAIESIVPDCMSTMCDSGYTFDRNTCFCIDTEPMSDGVYSVRQRRSSGNLLVSKLIRDNNNESVMQATSDQCRNNEQWNGNECIPLISLCPEGYHWNGHVCVMQVVTKSIALVPMGPDKKCAKNAKITAPSQQQQSHPADKSLPATVMPSYSTSPMCPFGFILSDIGCIRNPPTCPSQYFYHNNLCHLMMPSLPLNLIATTTQSTDDNAAITTELKRNLEHEIENSAAEMSAENDQNQHCCMIMSPRICRRIVHNRNEQWQCYHHQYKRCGDFCTKPNLYMRPKKTTFVEPLLIIPPPPRRLQKLLSNLVHREINIGTGNKFNFRPIQFCLLLLFCLQFCYYNFRQCHIVVFFFSADCSGCLHGGYGCSSECFAYDCNTADCEFIDEDLLCGISTTNDDDNSDVNTVDYENNLDTDVCAYSTWN